MEIRVMKMCNILVYMPYHLKVDAKVKLRNLLNKIAKENKKKGLNIKYKKIECMVVTKRNRS